MDKLFETEMATARQAFESEVSAKKETWKAEQALYDKNRKELDDQVKKDRKRAAQFPGQHERDRHQGPRQFNQAYHRDKG